MTAPNDSRGTWCGRAVHGVSSMTMDDVEQARAHRERDRPTPWQALAQRFNVNEVDLRRLLGDIKESTALAPRPPAPKPKRNDRDHRICLMWEAGASFADIMLATGLSKGGLHNARVRLGLPARHTGGRWRPADNDAAPRQEAA